MAITKEIQQQIRDFVINTPIGVEVNPSWIARKLKIGHEEVLKELFAISDSDRISLLTANLYVDYFDDLTFLSTYGIFKSLQGVGGLIDINDVECEGFPLSVAFFRNATLDEVEKARGVSFTTEEKADLAAIHNTLNQLERILAATRIEFERMATGGLKVQTTKPSYLSQ